MCVWVGRCSRVGGERIREGYWTQNWKLGF